MGFECMPLSYYNSGDLVLLIDGPVWVWYNPDKKEAKNLPIKGYWRQIFRYTASLMSIPGFEQVKWNSLKGQEVKVKMKMKVEMKFKTKMIVKVEMKVKMKTKMVSRKVERGSTGIYVFVNDCAISIWMVIVQCSFL